MPLARPWKPSMMLIEFATPPTAKAVKSTASGQYASTRSASGMSTRVRPTPVHQAASAPLPMVTSRRVRTLTRLVTSSVSPTSSAGMPASSSVVSRAASAGLARKTQAAGHGQVDRDAAHTGRRDGMEFLDRPRQVHREVPVLVGTQHERLGYREGAEQGGRDDQRGWDRQHDAFPFLIRTALQN